MRESEAERERSWASGPIELLEPGVAESLGSLRFRFPFKATGSIFGVKDSVG